MKPSEVGCSLKRDETGLSCDAVINGVAGLLLKGEHGQKHRLAENVDIVQYCPLRASNT